MGGSHSWAVVNRKIAEKAIFFGNRVSISSFNGYNCYTYDPNIYIDKFIGNIDYTISYTNPHNYKSVFSDRSRFKVALSNYESTILPPAWSDGFRYVDQVVVNSSYSRDLFLRAGFPDECVSVVPLGTDIALSEPMFRNGFFNFLNVSAPHSRKNIDQVIRCYYKAFSRSDDVCLTIKTSKVHRKSHFHVDVFDIIRKEQSKFSKKLPRLQILTDDLDSMSSLYSSCDALVSCSSSEGFGMPLLESLMLNLQVIAPDYSGQRDFLNSQNSFLLDAKEDLSPRENQYWHYDKSALCCFVDDDEVADNMIRVYNGEKKFNDLDSDIYSWDNTFESIIRSVEN